jgi:hypothetical protein
MSFLEGKEAKRVPSGDARNRAGLEVSTSAEGTRAACLTRQLLADTLFKRSPELFFVWQKPHNSPAT